MKKIAIAIAVVATVVLVAAFVVPPTVWEGVSPATNGSSFDAESEPYEVSFHVYVQRWIIGGAVPGAGYEYVNPTGAVMVKNTDSIPKTFVVEISHQYGDRTYTEEFTLEIEPGQMKAAEMSYKDYVSHTQPTGLRAVARHARDDDERYIHSAYVDGNWGIDYRITSVS